MSTQEHAKRELDLIGINGEDQRALLYILRLFFATWDSGGAVSVMVPILEKLLRHQPLSPLTGEADEWHQPMGGEMDLWQNVRCGTVFKNDKGAWDINAVEPGRPITFPYSPSEPGSLATVITFTDDAMDSSANRL